MRMIAKVKADRKWCVLTYAVKFFDITDDRVNYHIDGNPEKSSEFVSRIDKLWLDGVHLINKGKLV